MKKLCLAALLCVFSVPVTVFGCSCIEQPPGLAFNNARVVFIGRMLGGTQKLSVKDGSGKPYAIEAGEIRFSVDEIFKGPQADRITVHVDSHEGTSCGPYGLTRGERYIVYAYTGDDDKILYTGVCTRTTEASGEYAKEDLDFLRNLPPPGVGGELDGRIWADTKSAGGSASPLSDVRVKITGPEDQVITSFTDKNGEFKFKQLKPGKYKVEPEFPPNYTSEHPSGEAMVSDRGTASVGFEAYIDGRITGRIVDKDGNGFNHIFLELSGSGKRMYGYSTGADGVFEFKGAPPGEYVMYVELQGRNYSDRKPYYFPGTFEREKASHVRLGLAERLDGLEFRLPEEYRVRTIEGDVVWPDGTPAANVAVMLICPRSTKPGGLVVEFGPTNTATDEQGHFRLEGLKGETYLLEARGQKPGLKETEPIQMHSPARKLSPEGDLKNVKLKLSVPGGFGGGCSDNN
jgi:hypothetical protein